jgi:hypothetical protein
MVVGDDDANVLGREDLERARCVWRFEHAEVRITECPIQRTARVGIVIEKQNGKD